MKYDLDLCSIMILWYDKTRLVWPVIMIMSHMRHCRDKKHGSGGYICPHLTSYLSLIGQHRIRCWNTELWLVKIICSYHTTKHSQQWLNNGAHADTQTLQTLQHHHHEQLWWRLLLHFKYFLRVISNSNHGPGSWLWDRGLLNWNQKSLWLVTMSRVAQCNQNHILRFCTGETGHWTLFTPLRHHPRVSIFSSLFQLSSSPTFTVSISIPSMQCCSSSSRFKIVSTLQASAVKIFQSWFNVYLQKLWQSWHHCPGHACSYLQHCFVLLLLSHLLLQTSHLLVPLRAAHVVLACLWLVSSESHDSILSSDWLKLQLMLVMEAYYLWC